MIEWYQYVIAIAGGALAGAINTLAGNGSAITLSILTEVMGLPGNIANGTNRIGVFTQSSAGSYAFYRNGKLDLTHGKQNIFWTVIGALLGVFVAIRVSNEQFLFVFKYLMIAMLFVMLVKPKRWLKEKSEYHPVKWWIAIPVYLALGFYGGFIQMGMGIFYLATMVLVARYSMVEGNALKSFVVALYTLIVLLIFQYKGLVRWDVGIILAIGQTLGGWYTAKFASKSPMANKIAYWLLISIVLIVLARMFHFFDFLSQ
ncbi:MAG: sulfite exporter TauE/SafE family protein [Saprospiraceae bacterium]|nr:sulfite exporter TauE/SafE family protein [Saprospiraceae bacterium]